MAQAKKSSFEKSLQELEALVRDIDSGDLELETALSAFERGISLIRDCQKSLDAAEKRVQELTQTTEGLELTDLSQDLDDE